MTQATFVCSPLENGVTVKRVIIAGWHHDSNKGDAAILAALTRILGKECGCKINIYLQIPPDIPCWRSSLKHNRFYAGELVPLVPLLYLRPLWLPLKMLWTLYAILRCVLLLISPSAGRLLLTEEEKRTLDAFRQCDLVIGKGGHYIYHSGGISGLLGLCENLLPFLLSRRLRKPYIFVSISVGPFRSALGKLIATFVFSRAAAISVRERESLNMLNRLGSFRNVVLSTDLAFLWVDCLCEEKSKSPQKPACRRILIAPRAFFPDDIGGKKYYRYIRVLARTADYLALTHELAFITTARDEDGGEDDMRAVSDILELMKEKDRVRVLGEDLDPLSLIRLLREYDLIIGTRLHSVIFAVISETPFIGISYFGPKMNIMRDLGLGDFLIDIHTLADERNLLLKIDAVLNDYERVKLKIREAKKRAYEILLGDWALKNLWKY